jgi:hypothetical protein
MGRVLGLVWQVCFGLGKSGWWPCGEELLESGGIMPRIVSGCHEMLMPSLTYAKAHYPINCSMHVSALALVQLVCVMHHLRGLTLNGVDPIMPVLTVLLARRECCVFRWFCVCCLGMELRSRTSPRSNVYTMAPVATFMGHLRTAVGWLRSLLAFLLARSAAFITAVASAVSAAAALTGELQWFV